MQPDTLEEVRAWLNKASRDLNAAEQLVASDDPLLDIASIIASRQVRRR